MLWEFNKLNFVFKRLEKINARRQVSEAMPLPGGEHVIAYDGQLGGASNLLEHLLE